MTYFVLGQQGEKFPGNRVDSLFGHFGIKAVAAFFDLHSCPDDFVAAEILCACHEYSVW